MQCNAMQHALLWYAMICIAAMQCNAMQHALLWYAMICIAAQFHANVAVCGRLLMLCALA
jgi:hypothetical protein